MAQQKVEMYGVRHTYIEYNSGGTLAFHRAYLTKKCTVKVNSQKLEFSGDGVKYLKYYGYEAEGSIECSLDDTLLDGILWATTATAPQGGDDFATRYVKGLPSEMQSNYVGVRISVDASDADTGAPMVVRFRFPKVQFAPDTPQDMQTEAIVSRMLNWSARITQKDVAGTVLSGIPATGAFWVKDFLTDPTKFDPVAGDMI